MATTFNPIYRRSIEDASSFWSEVAQQLEWQKPFSKVIDDSNKPFYQWFCDGKINVCHNALDRHVNAGNGERAALIYDSPITGTKQSYTFSQLRDETAKVAGMLVNNGIGKGDRVVIYMPMVPQAVMAMLACARLGAIHSMVFGGFAADQLATRIDDAKAKLILSTSCGIEPSGLIEYKPMLDEALKISSHKPQKVIILQRKQHQAQLEAGRDLDWDAEISKAELAPCAEVAATDALFILYTSGTTGSPKGVVHDGGGYAVALNWTMHNIYGANSGDVFWAASDVGWIVGHSYIVYAPLLHGCTTILYEGKPVGTPDAGAFWRVISEHKVNMLFTAPTALRAIKREDPDGKLIKDYDISKLKYFFLAGERCDPDSAIWAEKHLGVPTIDHWWQTETGWAITALPYGIEKMPTKIGSAGVPMVGYDVHILDKNGKDVPPGEFGSIAVKLPLPPGTFPTLWRNEERYKQSMSIFDGYYVTGDAGYMDEDGHVFVMSRTDDVINVAGHRLSTGEMEEVLTGHIDIAEAAVFGVHDELKGQLPLGLVIKNASSNKNDEVLIEELIQLIRAKIGPVAAFKQVAIVAKLPKTRSGKILRKTLSQIANSEEHKVPPTIEDPNVLEDLKNQLQKLGYAR